MARDRKRGAQTGAAIGAGLALTKTPRAVRQGNALHRMGVISRPKQGKLLAVGIGGTSAVGAGIGAAVGRKQRPVQKNDTSSAFGVDHGEVSKSLPSALRGAKIPNQSVLPTPKLRMANRIAANKQGKLASRQLAGGTPGNKVSAQQSIQRGKDQKEYFNRGLGA